MNHDGQPGEQRWVERIAARWMLGSTRKAAAWWTAAIVVIFGISLVAGHGQNALIDLKVYRVGGLTWLHGLPLYSSRFPAPLPGPALPFTYPPFAAVAFSSLAVLGYHVAAAVMVVLGFVALTWTILLAVRNRVRVSADPAVTLPFAVLLTLPALVLEPVSSTFLHGQINLLLMGLVATDALAARTRLPRGALAGIAAAVKLTPAVFLLYFVARRQWRAAATMVASFGVATGLAALVAPRDSRTYWTATVFDPTRIGDLGYAANQSLRGVLHRLGLAEHTEVHAWLALSAAIVALAYLGARRFLARGEAAAALAVVAACQLLISPVSWSHHWVWAAPMLLPLAVRMVRVGTRLQIAGMLALAAVFLVAPQAMLPSGGGQEMRWAWWENCIGDSYAVVAIGFVVWSAVWRRATVRADALLAVVEQSRQAEPLALI